MILILLTVAGTLLRLDHRDYPVIWHDEAITLCHLASGYASDKAYSNRVLTMGEFKNFVQTPGPTSNAFALVASIAEIEPIQAPSSFLCFYLWGKLFGYSADTLRLMSVLFGVLGIVAAFWLGCELSSPICGLLMATFIAFSPYSLHHSRELRCYALYLLMFFIVQATFLRAVRVNDGRDKSSWFAYCASYATLFHTHLSSIVAGVGPVIFVAAGRKLYPKIVSPSALRHCIAATCLAYVTFIPWGIAFLNQARMLVKSGQFVLVGEGKPTAMQYIAKWGETPASLLTYNLQQEFDGAPMIIISRLVFISAVFVWFVERRTALYFLSIFLPYFLTLYMHDLLRGSQFTFYPKYMLGVTVLGLCVLCVALSHLWNCKQKSLKLLTLLVVAIVLFCEARSDLVEFSSRERKIIHGQSLIKISGVINSNPDALLIVSESGQYTNLCQLAALTHQVLPYVKVIWLPHNNFEVIPSDITHALVFNPAEGLLDEMKKRRFSIHPTDADTLYELKKSQEPVSKIRFNSQPKRQFDFRCSFPSPQS